MFYHYVYLLAFIMAVIFSPLPVPGLEKLHTIAFDFSSSNQGWNGEFSDYPADEESFFELTWGWGNLPIEVSSKQDAPKQVLLTKGLFLAGNNHSDDLFMFVRRQLDGLEPDALYELTFSLTVECNIPDAQCGIGGSPGESVYVKAGASAEMPIKINREGFYHLNVDKGYQSEGGEHAHVLGNLANSFVDANSPQHHAKYFKSKTPLQTKSDSNGRLWIFIGSDSGFEGATKFYIAEIIINLHKD